MLSRQQTTSTYDKMKKENDDDTVYANVDETRSLPSLG